MKRKLLGLTALLVGFLVVSSLTIIQPMQDPPGVSWISVTNYTVC